MKSGRASLASQSSFISTFEAEPSSWPLVVQSVSHKLPSATYGDAASLRFWPVKLVYASTLHDEIPHVQCNSGFSIFSFNQMLSPRTPISWSWFFYSYMLLKLCPEWCMQRLWPWQQHIVDLQRHQQQSELKDILVLMTIVMLARHGDHYFFEPGILMVSRFGMAVKGLFQRYTHVGPAHPGNNTHVSTTVFNSDCM